MSVQLTSNVPPQEASVRELVSVLDLARLVLSGPAPSSVAQARLDDPGHRKFSIVDSALWPKGT